VAKRLSYIQDTQCLKVKEEQILRVSENKMMKGIFAPKREDAITRWRWKNKNHYPLYSLLKTIRLS